MVVQKLKRQEVRRLLFTSQTFILNVSALARTSDWPVSSKNGLARLGIQTRVLALLTTSETDDQEEKEHTLWYECVR